MRRTFDVPRHSSRVLARVAGPGSLTGVRIRLRRFGVTGAADPPQAARDALEHARLRIRFDGRRTVDAPLGEFFGSGLGPARVRALMFAMDPGLHGWMTSWWPMPFRSGATLALVNASDTSIAAGDLQMKSARSSAWTSALRPNGTAGYFHAVGHRAATRPGRDWTFLDTRGAGTLVGITQTMRGMEPPYHLEGDDRAWVDGARTPQIQGTGTEDVYRGGWYWYHRTYTLPLFGSPVEQIRRAGCLANCRTAYRLFIADPISFGRSLRYQIEHGSQDVVPAGYGSTAYWYQRPRGG